MFIRGMSDTVKVKLDHFGPEQLEPGDIPLTNDAYTTSELSNEAHHPGTFCSIWRTQPPKP
jgi:N-methylhydantoinase B/oxoprolinase/acetone carboxylase alpha subunit